MKKINLDAVYALKGVRELASRKAKEMEDEILYIRGGIKALNELEQNVYLAIQREDQRAHDKAVEDVPPTIFMGYRRFRTKEIAEAVLDVLKAKLIIEGFVSVREYYMTVPKNEVRLPYRRYDARDDYFGWTSFDDVIIGSQERPVYGRPTSDTNLAKETYFVLDLKTPELHKARYDEFVRNERFEDEEYDDSYGMEPCDDEC
jgi:hypothetical protein